MAHLGEFGRELAAIDADTRGEAADPDTFTFHGEQFVIPAALSALPRLRYAHATLEVEALGQRVEALYSSAVTDEEREEAARVDHQGVTEWRAAVYRYARDVIGGEGTTTDQWDRFEAVVARGGVDMTELLSVVNSVVNAAAARPRMRSSVSPGGPSATGGGSTAGSDSTAGPDPATGRGGDSTEETPLTPAQRQRAGIAAMMQPVAEAARS